MNRSLAIVLTGILLGGAPSWMLGQGGPPAGPGGVLPVGSLQDPRRGEPRPLRNEEEPRRAELERRFQERLVSIVRQRLNLTDEQAARLREVASRAEDDRRALRREELAARFAMRQELLAGDQASESRVADLLEQLPRLERRRVDLLEREQRELAKFLSPVQRARYFGLQDELRRGMQELQQQRLAEPKPLRPGGGGGPLRRNRLGPPPP